MTSAEANAPHAAPGGERTLAARLARLADKGTRAAAARAEAATAAGALPPAQLPWWLPRRVAVGAVSQIYHGEGVTAALCAGLARDLPLAAARRCLEVQQADEAHHARLYRGYLDSLGGCAPIDPGLAGMFDRIARFAGPPEGRILALHVLLEDETLQLIQGAADWLPCPRFKQLSRSIARDEARHIAFGQLYLRAALPALPAQDREALYDWLRELWYDGAGTLLRRHALPGFAQSRWLDRRWTAQAARLQALGLGPVRPATL